MRIRRFSPRLAVIAIAMIPSIASTAHAAPSTDHDDEELPQLPPPAAPEPAPRGAQDGVIEGATAGVAAGLGPAAAPSGLRTPAKLPTASRYASLDRSTCEAELVRRHIPFERVAEARGVVAPLRLAGPVGGVTFHSMLPVAQRKTSPYEIYDCRLVLALDDFARILARFDITEVIHYSVYRPPSARTVLNGPGRRHTGALAIDAASFRTKDGRTIDVEKDFHGRIGAKTCGGPDLPGNAGTLRHLVCDAADAQLFNVLLTPDYNWPHRNHFHLEVTAGVHWILVR